MGHGKDNGHEKAAGTDKLCFDLLSLLTNRSPTVLIWPQLTLPMGAHPIPNQGPKEVT